MKLFGNSLNIVALKLNEMTGKAFACLQKSHCISSNGLKEIVDANGHMTKYRENFMISQNLHNRITITPKVLLGKPTIRGLPLVLSKS